VRSRRSDLVRKTKRSDSTRSGKSGGSIANWRGISQGSRRQRRDQSAMVRVNWLQITSEENVGNQKTFPRSLRRNVCRCRYGTRGRCACCGAGNPVDVKGCSECSRNCAVCLCFQTWVELCWEDRYPSPRWKDATSHCTHSLGQTKNYSSVSSTNKVCTWSRPCKDFGRMSAKGSATQHFGIDTSKLCANQKVLLLSLSETLDVLLFPYFDLFSNREIQTNKIYGNVMKDSFCMLENYFLYI
jgi:hypothetical protein